LRFAYQAQDRLEPRRRNGHGDIFPSSFREPRISGMDVDAAPDRPSAL
jgi:hypothetical protein